MVPDKPKPAVPARCLCRDVLLDFAGVPQEAVGEDLAAEVALVERTLKDYFIDVLEGAQGKKRRQELEADGAVANLAAQALQGFLNDFEVIEGQRRQIIDGKPGGVGRIGSRLEPVILDVDEGHVDNADNAFARIAVHRTKGVELL